MFELSIFLPPLFLGPGRMGKHLRQRRPHLLYCQTHLLDVLPQAPHVLADPAHLCGQGAEIDLAAGAGADGRAVVVLVRGPCLGRIRETIIEKNSYFKRIISHLLGSRLLLLHPAAAGLLSRRRHRLRAREVVLDGGGRGLSHDQRWGCRGDCRGGGEQPRAGWRERHLLSRRRRLP